MVSKNISKVKQALSFGKTYQNCAELPLDNFIKIASSGDLKHLVVFGFPTKAQLVLAWDAILSEYLVLSNSPQQNFMLTCMKEITTLSNKIEIIQALVDHLALHYHEGMVINLKLLGFRFKYNPENKEQYHKDLQLTVTQSKSLLIRLEQKKKDLNLLRSKESGSDADYDSVLTELSKFQGYRLNPKDVTVSEFLAILKRFKEANQPTRNGKN
jgi:hypothetical protein